ncbi:unnamed protein product (mitochondrion) [Plasmodiophora brassicae]|uniref:Uncharacterized protein n=1 Tax=Plasmodiophora brassicae TaxID=37360 RepID=A0A0G4J7D6_PLABS|nr:hypothetical protein PBRA_009413 [Plasmodiophora brassicae]SPR00930.1 unnamed protein product [Plasmodiophora brassicae]
MLSQRELLDQLMGKDRNLADEDKKAPDQHWWDDAVCKYYICGFCPHDLFYNTKSDLGPCAKQHDMAFRREFECEPVSRRAPYEADFLRLLESLTEEVDRRKRRGTDRLSMTMQPDLSDPVVARCKSDIDQIVADMRPLIDQMQTLAERGDVDDAARLLVAFEEKAIRKQALQEEMEGGTRFITQHEKQMGVCDICGAFLVQNEAESRVQSHLNGKQHVGFALIRDKIVELRRALADVKAAHHEPASRRRGTDRDRSRDRRRSSRSPRRSSGGGGGGGRRHGSPSRRHRY